MKNYLKFMFKYMHLDYYLFCLIVLSLLGYYLDINDFYVYITFSMIACSLMPSNIELEQARKEGLIKNRK